MLWFFFYHLYFFFSLNPIASNVVEVSAIQQCELAVCIHISSPSWASLPPNPHPIRLDPHRASSWAPWATQQHPTSYLFYTWQCIYVNAIPPIHSIFSFPPFPHLSTHPVSISMSLYSFYHLHSFCYNIPPKAHRSPDLQEVVELIFSFLERISKLFNLRNNSLRHSKYFSPQT